VQLAKPAPRLDAELLHQHHSRGPIRLERLSLAARAVQREHLLAAQALAQRMLGGQALQLSHHLVVAA
jgi:hypothetical protein